MGWGSGGPVGVPGKANRVDHTWDLWALKSMWQVGAVTYRGCDSLTHVWFSPTADWVTSWLHMHLKYLRFPIGSPSTLPLFAISHQFLHAVLKSSSYRARSDIKLNSINYSTCSWCAPSYGCPGATRKLTLDSSSHIHSSPECIFIGKWLFKKCCLKKNTLFISDIQNYIFCL